MRDAARARRTRRRIGLGALLTLLALAAGAAGWRYWPADGPVRPKGERSPIAEAARVGNFEQVRQILANGADVNQPAADGASALLWAAYHADLDALRTLLAARAKVDLPNRYGVTPLLQASRSGDAPIVEALLAAGAQPNLAHPSGQTPLMAAARSGHLEAVRLLLDRGADVNARDRLGEETALMWAAAEGHLTVVEALLDAGADPNARARVSALTLRGNADFPSGGFTALMWAARNGHDGVLQRLLERGADPKITNGDGVTATTVAIVNDRFDIAAALLDSGADATDGSLYHAVEMHDGTTDMYALDGTRLRADHPNRVTSLDLIKRLLDDGADPDQPFIGQLHSTSLCCGPFVTATPFYRAAIASDVAVLELMIARGADLAWGPSRLDAPGADGSFGTNTGANEYAGWPPLRVAMRGGRGAPLANGPGVQQRDGPPPFREPGDRRPLDAVKVLLAAGANPDGVGPDGSTALHEAAQAGQAEMIRALVDAGASLERRNKDGLTALDIAERAEREGAGASKTEPRDAQNPSVGVDSSRAEVVALLRQLTARPTEEAPTSTGTGGSAGPVRAFGKSE